VQEKLVYEHTFPLRHHWWIDSGIIGLYNIMGQLKDSNSQYHFIYYSVNMQSVYRRVGKSVKDND
jgi:hypothetical protein